jgi:two-component system nitrogen regulation sensor histidine kinase GlnL
MSRPGGRPVRAPDRPSPRGSVKRDRAWARWLSLQTRLTAGTVFVIALTMAVLIGIVEQRQRAAILNEVHRRGEALAKNLSAISSGPLLLRNFAALEQTVTRMARDTDVEYAIILDAEGKVAASSEGSEAVGFVLDDAVSRQAVAARALLVQERWLARTGHFFYDFAFPVEIRGQRAGTVRVGLSKQRVETEIAKTRRELALLALVTLVGGGLAAALVARRIARPVRQLAHGVAAISRGDLNQRIETASSDEIGQLALAFNHMASELLEERTALEAAHAELERRFAELSDLKSYTDHVFGSLTSGIVALDLDGRVVTLNPAAESLTGCRLADVRGRPGAEAFAHMPELSELLARALITRMGEAVVSASLTRPGAPPSQVELTTEPLRGAEGKDLGVVAVLRDLTKVRQLEEQLRRSDRLAALGTLAAGLAHEIKNPLTSLLTFSRHLSRRFGDERFRERFQSVVPRELERINAIVDGLLRLSRPSRLTLSRVTVPDLIEQVLELYGNQLDAKQITLVREYSPGLPAIDADREQLYQVVGNLVTNALDAMPDGGTLTVRTDFSDAGATAFVASGRWFVSQRIRIEIADTGAGIPPVQSAQVFDPFFTTKRSGTGLGLAIVHKIVEDHGGSIVFRPVPGGGTVFTVLLPLSGRRADRGVEAESPLGLPGRFP